MAAQWNQKPHLFCQALFCILPPRFLQPAASGMRGRFYQQIRMVRPPSMDTVSPVM